MKGPRPALRSVATAQQGHIVLIFSVITVGILLIGFTLASRLFLREDNQKRSIHTQKQLESAFVAIFPFAQNPRLKAKANMYSDFGYTPSQPGPPPQGWDLRALVDRMAVGMSDPFHATIPQADPTSLQNHTPAWNGPYWQGSVDSQNRPVDAWGRPLQLRFISTSTPPGWQVFSLGSNGVSETGDTAFPQGDDLVYPATPYLPPSPCLPELVPSQGWRTNSIYGWNTDLSLASGKGAILTNDQIAQSGSVFWPQTLDCNTLTIEFDFKAWGGWGGDGICLAFADANQGMSASFCATTLVTNFQDPSNWNGCYGMKGVFLTFDTTGNGSPPHVMGLYSGTATGYEPTWLKSVAFNFGRNTLVHCKVVIRGGTLTATLQNNNAYSFSYPIAMPTRGYVGFTAACGLLGDYHWVGNVCICPN